MHFRSRQAIILIIPGRPEVLYHGDITWLHHVGTSRGLMLADDVIYLLIGKLSTALCYSLESTLTER